MSDEKKDEDQKSAATDDKRETPKEQSPSKDSSTHQFRDWASI